MVRDNTLLADYKEFNVWLKKYFKARTYVLFSHFEAVKDVVTGLLYKRRGKYARPFLHTLVLVMLFVGITIGPLIVKNNALAITSQDTLPSGVLMSTSGQDINGGGLATVESEDVLHYRGGEIYNHTVQAGETLRSIADQYSLKDVNTIVWLNNLSAVTIKPGQILKILPVDGVLHQVKKGDTICSIAKLYGLIGKDEDCGSGAQPIIDYPFNTFTDDQFDLQVGQYLVVPDGVMPGVGQTQAPTIARQMTPNAGTVSASGAFIWPASGIITQGFSWYHKGIDIANHSGGSILAADSGRVFLAGWDTTGYGNRIMIDHGNGYMTLYGHLSVIAVQEGQTVHRGDVVGQMGSTGRSTGTHLHFEIRHGGIAESPLTYLH